MSRGSGKTTHWERLNAFLRIVFGFIFVWASWDKLMDPQAFAEVIHNYQILPALMVNPVAVILPWIELVCGVMLALGFMRGGALLILNGLLVVFGVALALSMYKGLDISCGCFTLDGGGEKIAFETLGRDGLLFALGLWLAYWESKKGSMEKASPEKKWAGPKPPSTYSA
jgi:hypothetical protein